MKKFLIIFLLPLVLWGCGSDEPTIENTTETEAANIAAHLNGAYHAEWESIGVTQHEEWSFTPYSSPQTQVIAIPGQYADIEKTVTIFGRVSQSTYYDNHLLEVMNDYLYSIEIAYIGATPRLVVYNYSVDDMIAGNYQTFELRNVESQSFEMKMSGEYRLFTKTK